MSRQGTWGPLTLLGGSALQSAHSHTHTHTHTHTHRVHGRSDSSMAEILRRSPETITTCLIGYTQYQLIKPFFLTKKYKKESDSSQSSFSHWALNTDWPYDLGQVI